MPRNKYPDDKSQTPFASALRKLMVERNTTQEELAKIAGKTRQTISQYTNGISEPGYETLVKIADYFDVSVDYLLGRTKDPKRNPCATDELGLSATVIEKMINFRNNSSIGKDGIDGLNALIDEGFLLLAHRIKTFCDHVSEDIELGNEYETSLQEEETDYRLRRFFDDIEIAQNIEELISKQRPDHQGRFCIITGPRFIAAEKREIVDEFERMLRIMSEYDLFLSKLPNDGCWL